MVQAINKPLFKEALAKSSTMVDYSERLQAAMKLRKITVTELADGIGLSYQAVKKVFDGKSNAFTAENNARAAKHLGIYSDWLATGLGPMQISNTEPGPELRGMVPLISWVQAGAWCEVLEVCDVHRVCEPAPPDYHDSTTYLPCPAPHSRSTFALRVKGDSMTATHGRSYPDGCIIYVDPEQRSPKNGDRIVACLEGSGDSEVTFKIYKNEDGRQWLLPLNTQHPPLFERFTVIGTVIGKWEDG